MKFLKNLPSFFSPFCWTTTAGQSAFVVPSIDECRQDFLSRLVKLSPTDYRIFAFDGKHFYLGRKRGTSLQELNGVSCSDRTKSLVPLVTSGNPPKKLYDKFNIIFEFDNPVTLEIYVEGSNTHSPDFLIPKFQRLLEMVKCSDIEEKFVEFESHLTQLSGIKTSIAKLETRIKSLKEVAHAYETLETSHTTKKALFSPQYEQATQELLVCQKNLRENIAQKILCEEASWKVIESIREDVERTRKIALLTSHLPETL